MQEHNNTSPNPQVVDRMQQIIERWQAAADPRADFLGCYQMMTSNMLAAIDAGEFNDPQWVHRLLHNFAGYYFHALDAYEQDQVETPQVWRLTFDSARQPDALVLQNLLLGINAHINYDLIFTLEDMLSPEWQQLSRDQRLKRYEDHCHVNEVIRRTIDSVQDTIIESKTPLMNIVDELLGQSDEWIVSQMISRWRDDVWDQAQRLLDCNNPEERQSICQQIEVKTINRAQLIQQIFPGG
jgi:hypothetical protein